MISKNTNSNINKSESDDSSDSEAVKPKIIKRKDKNSKDTFPSKIEKDEKEINFNLNQSEIKSDKLSQDLLNPLNPLKIKKEKLNNDEKQNSNSIESKDMIKINRAKLSSDGSSETPSYFKNKKEKEVIKKPSEKNVINSFSSSSSKNSKSNEVSNSKSQEVSSNIINKSSEESSNNSGNFVNSIDLFDKSESSENSRKMYKPFNFEEYDIFSLSRHGRFIELETILLRGVDPDSRDSYGNTILIIGAQNGNKRIVKLALRYGGQINMFNHLGNTALHFAVEYKYHDLIDYLVRKGADPKMKNFRGLPAYQGVWQK